LVAEIALSIGDVQLETTPAIRSLIAGLGRTEDLRFSPNGRRLAVAGYLLNQIVVLDIDIQTSMTGKVIAVDGGVVISSPALKRPHGLDFLDDETLIVANRGGGVPVFRVPGSTSDVMVCEMLPIRELVADGVADLHGPGSVVVFRESGSCEVYICNNFSNTLTRHHLDVTAGYRHLRSEILLHKWMDVPDGVAMSTDREWLAVSQAASGLVCVYPNSASLGTESDPSAMLRQVYYPHGLVFSDCNRFLLVADAGRPNIHVFKRPEIGWYGALQPMMTAQVMGEAQFQRGHVHPDEGGPKGLDLHRGSGIVALTCEYQTLALFDVSEMLARLGDAEFRSSTEFVSIVSDVPAHDPLDVRSARGRAAAEVAYELHRLSRAKEAAEAGIEDIKRTRSWRITAPLRGLNQLFKRV